MDEKVPCIVFGDTGVEARQAVRGELRKRGWRVCVTESLKELLELAERCSPDLIVIDERLDDVGRDVLSALLIARSPRSRVLMLRRDDAHEADDSGNSNFLVLPASLSDAALMQAILGSLRKAAQTPAPERSRLIMCVDDDTFYLGSLSRILRRHGYAVITCTDAEEALEAIPLVRPSMIFLDILMPGMNGLDLAQEIREEYGEAIPLVLLSGKSSDQEIAEGYRSGACYYITKPCEPKRILNIADYLIGNLAVEERRILEAQL